MINNITGIILAGGKSTRIGTDKAFLKIGGSTMIEEILSKMKNVLSEVIIIAEKKEKFSFLGVQIVPDIIPLKGPLGGIYTGLLKSDSFYNFIAACDMPFLCQDVIEYILEQGNGYDVVVPEYKGRLETLCALYSKNCLKFIKDRLSEDNFKITGFFEKVRVKKISEQEIIKFDPEGISFLNINTPREYNRYKQIAESSEKREKYGV